MKINDFTAAIGAIYLLSLAAFCLLGIIPSLILGLFGLKLTAFFCGNIIALGLALYWLYRKVRYGV